MSLSGIARFSSEPLKNEVNLSPKFVSPTFRKRVAVLVAPTCIDFEHVLGPEDMFPLVEEVA
jgi:hypothetical protein